MGMPTRQRRTRVERRGSQCLFSITLVRRVKRSQNPLAFLHLRDIEILAPCRAHWAERVACRPESALRLVEPCESDCGAKLENCCLLPTRGCQRAGERSFRSWLVGRCTLKEQLRMPAVQL